MAFVHLMRVALVATQRCQRLQMLMSIEAIAPYTGLFPLVGFPHFRKLLAIALVFPFVPS
ncbi:hypothetical protein WL57_02020 [Burkholderia cepacia]|nr:hypothetical protein WL57_02020 [Burkholderia cepacia]